MESFPPEVTEKVIQYLSRNENLGLRKVCRALNAVVLPRVPQLIKPEICQLTNVVMRHVGSFLYFTARTANVESALHFLQVENRAENVRRIKNPDPEVVECAIKIRTPSDANTVVALFDNARIGNFLICTDFPFYLDDGNASILTRLLTGCTIDHIRLVIDNKTSSNLSEVPAFLQYFHCKSVEFVLKLTEFYDMLQPFTSTNLAAALAASGVEEVSFKGNSRSRRDVPELYEGLLKPTCPFSVFTSLVGAGITRISADRRAFWRRDERASATEFINFAMNLSMLNRPLNVTIETSVSDADSLMPSRVVNGTTLRCAKCEDDYTKWHRVSITKD